MIILTLDTDWAPREITEAVLEKVKKMGIKCTVFFSTPGPAFDWPLLEVGCHPDLSRRRPVYEEKKDGINAAGDPFSMASLEEDKAVDKDEARILSAYRSAFPEAGAIRTHRFYWHSDLSRNIAGHGFEHDSSVIQPYHPNLMGFRVGKLCRWPVWASDHLHLARKLPLDRLQMPNFEKPGLKIFCFHVAYLHLNAGSLNDFNMIRQRLDKNEPVGGRPGPGIWNLFEMLAEKVYKQSTGWWLKDIPDDFVVNPPHDY